MFLNGLARGCLPADHELFFSRARAHGAQGRRRRARHRRADGLPARLRRRRSARTPRSSSIDVAEPERDAPARGRRPSSTATSPATLDALRRGAGGARHDARGSRDLRGVETREARGRARAARRRPRAPLHPMRLYARARRGARPRRDRDRRRRRLRLLRRPRRRLLRAGLLAGPGPVRLPRLRARLRAGGQARAPRPPGRAAARRRRLRLLAGWSSTRSRATASTSSA